MATETVSLTVTDPIEAFCRKFASENQEKWPPDEKDLALSFLAHFKVEPIFDLKTLNTLCEKLEIEVSTLPIPDEFKGYNCVYGTRRVIIISEKQDFVAADQQTILHEIREVLEHEFDRIGRPIAVGGGMETRAEGFAIYARMYSTIQISKMLFDDAAKITHTWKRRGAYVLIIAGTTIYGVLCAILPHMEKANRNPK